MADDNRRTCIKSGLEQDIRILCREFPEQIDGVPRFDDWEACRSRVGKVKELAETLQELGGYNLQVIRWFGEVLKRCVSYLHEVGRLNDALELLHIAFQLIPECKSGFYVRLCDIAAAIYYEKNNLRSCQEFNEKSQRIREAGFCGNPIEELLHYQNRGKLAAAQGKYEEAFELYHQIGVDYHEIELQERHSYSSYQNHLILGLTLMMASRVHLVRKEYKLCKDGIRLAKNLFIDLKISSPLYAQVRYINGNVMYATGDYVEAETIYLAGQEHSNEIFQWHILTAMFDYKLGMIRAEQKKFEKAMNYLQQALTIAKHNDDDGHIARILRRQALVIRAKLSHQAERTKQADTPTSEAKEGFASAEEQRKEADELMAQAEALREKLVDPADHNPSLSEDEAYDNLICPDYR